jgi:hypothetical protein
VGELLPSKYEVLSQTIPPPPKKKKKVKTLMSRVKGTNKYFKKQKGSIL